MTLVVKENNEKNSKLKVGEHLRILKYKNVLVKGCTPNWSEEVFIFYLYWKFCIRKTTITSIVSIAAKHIKIYRIIALSYNRIIALYNALSNLDLCFQTIFEMDVWGRFVRNVWNYSRIYIFLEDIFLVDKLLAPLITLWFWYKFLSSVSL